MFSYLLHLTDISIVTKLPEAMERNGDTILKICHKLKKNPEVEEVLANYEPNTAEDKAVCIILLLLAYFKEARDAIILQADVGSLANTCPLADKLYPFCSLVDVVFNTHPVKLMLALLRYILKVLLVRFPVVCYEDHVDSTTYIFCEISTELYSLTSRQ